LGVQDNKMVILRRNSAGGYFVLPTGVPSGGQSKLASDSAVMKFTEMLVAPLPATAEFLRASGVQKTIASVQPTPIKSSAKANVSSLTIAHNLRFAGENRFESLQVISKVTPNVSVSVTNIEGQNKVKIGRQTTSAQSLGVSYSLSNQFSIGLSATAQYNRTTAQGAPLITAAKAEYTFPVALPNKGIGKVAFVTDFIWNGPNVTARQAAKATIEQTLNRNVSVSATLELRAALSLTGQPFNYQAAYGVALSASTSDKLLTFTLGAGTTLSTTGLSESAGQTFGINASVKVNLFQ
jgi:hypothetical protein